MNLFPQTALRSLKRYPKEMSDIKIFLPLVLLKILRANLRLYFITTNCHRKFKLFLDYKKHLKLIL